MSEEEVLLKIKSAFDGAGIDKAKAGLGALGGAAAKAGAAAAAGLAVAGAAAAAVGVAAFKLGREFEDTYNVIRVGTGASGEALDGLKDDFRAVASQSSASLGEVGTLIADLNTATGQTGEPLQRLTKQFLDLKQIGLDASVGTVTRLFGDWGIAADDQAAAMDHLLAVNQATGVSIDRLSQLSVAGGATFRSFGFSVEETSAMFGRWEKEGVNTEIVIGGLKKATSTFGKEGVNLREGLEANIEAITNAKDATEAWSIAAGVVGSDAASDWADTIRGGKMDMDEFMATIDGSTDTIAGLAEETKTAGQKLDEMKNKAKLALEPIAQGAVDAASAIADALMPKVTALGDDLLSVFGPATEASEDFGERMAMVGEDDMAAAAQGASGFKDELQKIKDKFDDVKAAFEDGGIQGALEEIVGFDLQPIIDGFVDIKDKVVDATKFLNEHRGIVIGAIAVYAAFKTAIAIGKTIDAAKTAIASMKSVWTAYKTATNGATLATGGFSTALKIATGPIGWIILAVGLLYVAWKTNFGGIQEKTKAVVDWLKTVPAQVKEGFGKLMDGAAELMRGWKEKWDGLGEKTKLAIRTLLLVLFPLPLLFTKFGRDTIQGLWDGMKAIWSKVTGWFKDAASKLAGILPKGLKMGSPSRVMYEQGYWIIQGLALGLEAASGLVTDAFDRATGAIADWTGSKEGIGKAREAVEALAARAHDLRTEFLSGGAAQEGSLAWFVGKWGDAPDFAAVFSQLDIPVDSVEQFQHMLDQLVSEGEYERAQELWAQFYDAIGEMANEQHEAAIKAIEDEGLARQREIEAEKRRIDELLKNQREKEQELGLPETALKDFSDEKKKAQAALAPILAMIGYVGDQAIDDFWTDWTGGADDGVKSAEDLIRAIDTIGEEWQRIIGERKDAEDADHAGYMQMLTARAALIDNIIANQRLAEEELADLIAERDRLLEQAREAIRDAQAAAEEFENRVHAGVMANIAEQRKAWTDAHNEKMRQMEAERADAEEFHNAIVSDLEERRNAIGAEFEQREKAIDQMRADLTQLKLDLGVEAAMMKLTEIQAKLQDLKTVAASFTPEARGREELDRQRKAATERVRARTDEQRAALQAAKDSGKLNTDQLRTVELLMLGYKQKATDVAEIMALMTGDLEEQEAQQKGIVDANAAQIKAKQDEIDLAEQLLSIDKTRAQALIDDLEARIKAENERWAIEKARLDGGISAEKAAHDARMAYLDEQEQRENDRHAQRMSDIASEYALMLAQLGMSQDEIEKMIAAAQALADQVAAETKAIFDEIKAGAPTVPPPPTPVPGDPGGERGGPGIGKRGAGEIVVEGGATVAEGTIESVMLGGVTINPSVTVSINGRDIAAQIIEVLEGDTMLIDKLGNRLNERANQRGGTTGP